MTIASVFNEIAVANGGTADKSGTIAGAVDALTDALAGSDQPAPQTIEQGVRMLGEHIGGGGGGGGTVDVYTSFNGVDFPAPTVDGVSVTLEPVAGSEGIFKFSAPVGAIVSTSLNRHELTPTYTIYDSLESLLNGGVSVVNFISPTVFTGDTKYPPVASLHTFIGFTD